MNWTITLRKFLEGAVAGGLAAAAGMVAVPGDDNYWAALGAAVLTGAIRGGLNAFKHMGLK